MKKVSALFFAGPEGLAPHLAHGRDSIKDRSLNE